MKKAIVTGANGFVGSAVCRALSARGIKVTAVVRNIQSNVERISDIENISIIYSDMASYKNLENVISDRGYECFFHFAWNGSAGALRGNYHEQLRNVEYSCDAVKAAKMLGCRRFVFAASIMEYEVSNMVDENRKLNINTLYSTSKLAAEYMLRAVANASGIEYVGGIISNIYGPGEFSPRLVNTTIRKLQNGEHCSFSPGEQMYDFIFIDDAAEAFCILGESARENFSYYIGSANPRPLKEFLNIIKDVVSPEAQIGLGEIPFGGAQLYYTEFDINALNKDTGFVAKVHFADGIQRTAMWLKGNCVCE